MASSSIYPFLLISFLFLISSTSAFNITHILKDHPDFVTFNSLLMKTKLASAINKRQSITVLAVNNTAASALLGKPKNIVRRILSVHVLLDFYGMHKFEEIRGKSVTLTTLFQASGKALHRQGFITVKVSDSGKIHLGPAGDKPLNSVVLSSIYKKPFNISVLHISHLILPRGIEKVELERPPLASPPAPSLESDSSADSPEYGPTADGPIAKAPVARHGPIADAPSPTELIADGPIADAPGPFESVEDSSAAVASGTWLGILMVLACFVVL